MNFPSFDPALLEMFLKAGAIGAPIALAFARLVYVVGYRAAVRALRHKAATDNREDFLDYLVAELPADPPTLFGRADKKPPR